VSLIAGDPILQQQGSALVVRHREQLISCVVNGDQGRSFTIQSLNPRQESFNWAKNISALFTFYRWRSVKLTFRSKVNNASPNTLPNPASRRGSVAAYIDYDARNYVPASDRSVTMTQAQIMDTAGAVETPIGYDFTLTCDCNPRATNNSELLSVFPGDPGRVEFGDRSISYAFLVVLYEGPALTASPINMPIYDVYIDYELELYKPRALDLYAAALVEKFACRVGAVGTGTVGDTHIFGSDAETVSDLHYTNMDPLLIGKHSRGNAMDAIIGIEDGNATPGRNRIAFDAVADRIYQVVYQVTGTGLGTTGVLGVNLGSGFVAYDGLMNGTTNLVTGGDDKHFTTIVMVRAVADQSSNTYTLSGSVHSQSSGDYWIDFDASVSIFPALSVSTGCDVIISEIGSISNLP